MGSSEKFPSGAPWFVFEDGGLKTQNFCTIWPENKSYVKAISELEGERVLASSYGWLLLHNTLGYTKFSLWNPISLESISLPPLDLEHDYDTWISSCALTSSPDDDCNFGVFIFCEHLAFSCHPRSTSNGLRKSGWRLDEIKIHGDHASVALGGSIACNGVMYAVVTTGYIITVKSTVPTTITTTTTQGNHDDDDSLVVPMPDVIDPRWWTWYGYLLESCGQVYYVCFSQGNWHQLSHVEVWELDVEKKNWVQVKSLNDRAFFVGVDCCTWCWSTPQVEANSVFFHGDVGGPGAGRNTLYQYSLDGGSLTVYSPFPTLQANWTEPFWFIPHQPRSLCKPSIKEVNNSLSQIAEVMELPNQNEAKCNMLDCLPLDLIPLISKYLDWFDYMSFRTTCKCYRSALPPGRCHWKRTYDTSLPLFVYLKNNGGLFQVMDPTRNNSSSIISPRPPEGAFYIEYCKDGWLVLYSGTKTYEYFNLFTKVRGEFPPAPIEDTQYFASVGFSTSPDYFDCMTVGIYGYQRPVHIYYFRLGDQMWEYAKFDDGLTEFGPSSCQSVYHNEGFYFLDYKGLLGVFKLVAPKPTWHVYERPQTIEIWYESLHLLECDGQLFSLFIGTFGKWIQVFRFNEENKSWVIVESLGKHVFFISRSSSISIIAREAEMSNRIYLPRLVDNRFMYYSLETRKYHVHGIDQKFSMENFYRSKELIDCCWA